MTEIKRDSKGVAKTDSGAASLLEEIRSLIEQTREGVAASVNAGLTMLNWRIGERLSQEVLKGERAEYGKEIVVSLSRQLELEYGKGFSEKNIRRMIQFSEVFPNEEIVVSLVRQLSWTHFIALIPIKDDLRRQFYSEMCRLERWSVRTLRSKIDSMLYSVSRAGSARAGLGPAGNGPRRETATRDRQRDGMDPAGNRRHGTPPWLIPRRIEPSPPGSRAGRLPGGALVGPAKGGHWEVLKK